MIRTLFLLKYLDDPELRRTIHAATNKSEQFNDFAQWLTFGGEGVIAENVRHEQRKVIKYNHLVANMVILYNVQWMSRKLKELQEKGHPVDAEVLKVLSPYRREHVNRFGDYLLDLKRPVPPLDSTIDFAFKSATYIEMRQIFNESRSGLMPARLVGPDNWKKLHLAGVWLLAIIFAGSFLTRVHEHAAYLVPGMVMVAAMLLRMAARFETRG
ncbi:phosphoribulokinase [Paraburkholderia sp. MM5477-R1]